MKKVLVVLLLGAAAGGAGGYSVRPTIERHVGGELSGTVVAERIEEERLVLTVRSGEETFLLTFRERRDDIAELVTPGDTLTVRAGDHGVFADDVPILRLRRAADVAARPGRRRHGRGASAETAPETPPETGAETPAATEVPGAEEPHVPVAGAAHHEAESEG